MESLIRVGLFFPFFMFLDDCVAYMFYFLYSTNSDRGGSFLFQARSQPAAPSRSGGWTLGSYFGRTRGSCVGCCYANVGMWTACRTWLGTTSVLMCGYAEIGIHLFPSAVERIVLQSGCVSPLHRLFLAPRWPLRSFFALCLGRCQLGGRR